MSTLSQTHDELALSLVSTPFDRVDHVRGRRQVVVRLLAGADATALTAAYVATLLAGGIRNSLAGGPTAVLLALLPLAIVVPGVVAVAALAGLYERDVVLAGHSTADELPTVTSVALWAAVGVYTVSLVEGRSWAGPSVFFGFGLFAIVLVPAARAAARSIARRTPGYRENVLILGAGSAARLVARKLAQHREYGLDLVGLVDGEASDDPAVLGDAQQLQRLIADHQIARVIVTAGGEKLLEPLRSIPRRNVQIDVMPELFQLVASCGRLHSLEGLPLIALSPARISRVSTVAKRAVDVVGASIGLLLTSPLFAVIALRIKRDSPGPVFFRQVRLGKDMQRFTMLKFRTMWQDTDDAPHRSYIEDALTGRSRAEGNGLYKLQREDAVTPAGRWLRRSSLDELPQLINVLRGDMSLVGPRPCIPYEVEHFEPRHFDRFLVPAGMTGLWQTSARARATFGEALDMDVSYVHAWSPALDAVLLARTVSFLTQRRSTS